MVGVGDYNAHMSIKNIDLALYGSDHPSKIATKKWLVNSTSGRS